MLYVRDLQNEKPSASKMSKWWTAFVTNNKTIAVVGLGNGSQESHSPITTACPTNEDFDIEKGVAIALLKQFGVSYTVVRKLADEVIDCYMNNDTFNFF